MQPELLAAGLAFPEGPALAPDGALWFVELEGGTLTRYDAGNLARYACGGAPNGLAFDHAGRAWICDAGQRSVRRFDPATGNWMTIVDARAGAPLLAPNDLAFDPRGNLLFTCPGESTTEPEGYVCCLRPDGGLLTIADGLFFPNGLAFADDGQTLIVAETYRQRLWRGAWDAAGCQWLDPQPWADVGGTTDGPDGMAFGADGLLYVAVYSLGCVKTVNRNGETVAVYAVPGNNPTNVAFDLSGGLVVTEAERGLLLRLPWLGPGAVLYNGQEHSGETL